MKRLFVFLLLVLVTLASAQDARSLAMGGVILPDRSAASVNPAYAASSVAGPANSVPLPIGLLNALVNEKLKIGNKVVDETGNTVTTFDILAAIDQASYLNTFIFNLPSSPEEINLDGNEDGQPVLSFEGGSRLSLGTVSYSNDFSLPLNFAAGPVRVGLRPYVFVNGKAVPDADFRKLFTTGSASGTVDVDAAAEAGLAIDVFYAVKLPDALLDDVLKEAGLEGTNLYIGIRGAPFFGLARADASATATIEANTREMSGTYSIDGKAFYSTIGVNGFGYGLVTDLGAAADIPVDGALFSVGLGLKNIGLGVWSGEEYTVTADSANDEELSFSDPAATSRVSFAPNFGVTLNGAYQLDTSALPPLINSVVIAADLGFGTGGFATHVGSEGVFGFENVNLAARAGIGYDDGFKLGLGGGVSFGSVSFDLALASHTAPFTRHQSFGVAASIGF